MRNGTAWIAASGPASAMFHGAGNRSWTAVERGAAELAAELGAEPVNLSPPTESDAPAQIARLEDRLAKGVNGAALAPTGPKCDCAGG